MSDMSMLINGLKVAAEKGATFERRMLLLKAASPSTQISGEVIPSEVPGSLAMGVRQPAGVVLGIAPWNAPIILGVRAIAVPLAGGNTVIFQGSENCPRTHQRIIECFQDTGFPPGVVEAVVAHRAALDHAADHAAPLPVLSSRGAAVADVPVAACALCFGKAP